MLDDFVRCFPTMHTYTMVNQFLRFVGDYSFDSMKSDVTTAAGDYISHLECRHEKIEPGVCDQDFIMPHRFNIEGSFSCNVCSRGHSPSISLFSKSIHLCSLVCDICYASRSFLVHYNVNSGTDHDMSKQELSLTRDNVPNFFFSPPNKPLGDTTTTGGKDIRVYREEALRTLTDFMDSQLTKFKKDHPTSHHLHANELRKHLSCIDQPLKKSTMTKVKCAIKTTPIP